MILMTVVRGFSHNVSEGWVEGFRDPYERRETDGEREFIERNSG